MNHAKNRWRESKIFPNVRMSVVSKFRPRAGKMCALVKIFKPRVRQDKKAALLFLLIFEPDGKHRRYTFIIMVCGYRTIVISASRFCNISG